MEQEERLVAILHHLPVSLSWVCVQSKCRCDCGSVYLLWSLPRNIPSCGQGIRNRLRAGASARERSWLVQHHGRTGGTNCEHRCWVAVGPYLSLGRVFLLSSLRGGGRFRPCGFFSFPKVLNNY